MPPIQPSEVGPVEGVEETKDEDTPLSTFNNINHFSASTKVNQSSFLKTA